jgi:hypothetical protein
MKLQGMQKEPRTPVISPRSPSAPLNVNIVEEVEAVRLIPWKDLKKRLEEQDAEFVPMPASSISRYSKFFDTLQERYP